MRLVVLGFTLAVGVPSLSAAQGAPDVAEGRNALLLPGSVCILNSALRSSLPFLHDHCPRRTDPPS
jgi:hypothetical protein